jgi:hypothetical protein
MQARAGSSPRGSDGPLAHVPSGSFAANAA